MIVERVPVSDLHCDPANARVHGPRNISTIKASLARFGQQKPIVVDKSGVVRAGNGTLLAAQELGWDSVSVTRTELQGSDATAYAIADNRTSELAEWDDEVLAASLESLAHDGLLDETGFDQSELDTLLEDIAEPPEIIEDEVPEPPEDPITQPGDLWILGEHRLLCGDSTKAEDVERLMDGERADACLTDPPYGIDYDYDGFDDSSANAQKVVDSVMPFILALPCAVLTPGQPAVWNFPIPTWVGAWLHPAPSSGCSWGFPGTNLLLFYGADPYLKRGLGRRPDSITQAADRLGVDGHPCPKPLKVWSWLLERVSPETREIIFDPFLGSGTTLIAAEQLGRKCYGMEISPAYCDVIVQRWETLTGKKGELDGPG